MTEIRLPFKRTFLEGVPLRFVNLTELSRGTLDSRDLAEDGYWKVASEEPVAYLMLRDGRPYRIIGHESPDLGSFVRFLTKDSRELCLTFRFVDKGCLPCLLRIWTEEPVLRDLKQSANDTMELLRSLKKSKESGLLQLRWEENLGLVPVSSGKISKGFLPGRTVQGRDLLNFLSKELPAEATGDFYPGKITALSPVGVAEVSLLVSSFNNWLEALRPTWPECDDITQELFRKLCDQEKCMQAFKFYMEDGLFLKKPLEQTDTLPGVLTTLIKGIAEHHASEETCIKVFGSANRENKMALASAGLNEIVGKPKAM
ncbi:hypothetical protein GF402_07120 [Candidatus Fermentibacteria bacterium]|nr:hypothetical protein [Candidatus Fermentibacteria bacterium]